MSKNKENGLKLAISTFSVLFVITLLSTTILTNLPTNADNPASANASVFVSSACTMSGGNNDYVDTLANGEAKVYGPSTIKAVCNDASGLAIYAVGYSGDTMTGGNNDKMLARATSSNIITATDDNPGSGSYWAMKITAVSGTYTPTIENSFDRTDYHIVPTTMTKIASLNSATDQSTGSTEAEGSSVNANYKVSIASAQPADEYQGKVKYVLVHPNTFTLGTYNINYLANGGTGTMTSQTDLANYEDQTLSSITGPTSTITPPTGYRFVGWCDATESTPATPTNPQTTCPGNLYTDGDTIPASTVSATATRSIASTTLNLYAVYAHYSELALMNTNATITGSTSTTITRGNTTPDTTITNPQRSYTVSGLEANGVGGSGATVTFPQAGACAANSNSNPTTNPTCTYNYIFSGWYTASTSGTKIINSDSTFTTSNGYTDSEGKWNSNDTPTLYSQWLENTDPTNTITLPTITKEGHTCGWATSNSTTTRTYESGQTLSPLTADTILYGTCTANNYTQTIKYRYENADGSFTNYTTVTTDVTYGTQYSWSTDNITNFDSTTYQAASVPAYTVTGEKTTEVDIMRNIITCTKQYRLQNADGTWGDYTSDGSTTALYDGSCSYEKTITDYKGAADAANDTAASTTASNVTSTQTLSLDFYRNTFALTINRNTTAIASTTGADAAARWGQNVSISANLATGYHFTTWSQTAGTTGSFGSTTSASTTFTMPKSAATIYADGAINTYTCTKQYRLQNADGTYPSSYTSDGTATINYGGTCNYEKAVTNYTTKSGSKTNMTSNQTISLDLPRTTYTLTVSAGSNTSSPTGGGTYRWGQTVTVGVTKAANTTCKSYATPTWSRTAGSSGTLNSTSGTSVTFTMGTSNATVTATSTASNVNQTITFQTSNATNITLNGNTKTNNQTLSIACGTYNVTGTFPAGYGFSSWSKVSGSGSFASTSTLATTFTVSGAATIKLTGRLTMQNITSSVCTTTAQTAYDSRDGEAYKIQKLSDGKCWMLDNLRLGSTSTIALTTSNSNVKANWTLPKGITSGFNSYTAAQINVASKNTVASVKYGSGSGKIGVYYNFCAASAGTICTSSNSSNASYDICPKGWQIPNGSGYTSLYSKYSKNVTNFRNALSTPLSGYFYSGSASSQGSVGYFWTSGYYNSTQMYGLLVNSSTVAAGSRIDRAYGYSIRCVLKQGIKKQVGGDLLYFKISPERAWWAVGDLNL